MNRAETSRPYIREWSLYDVLFWSPDVQPTPPSALAYREPTLGQVFARSDWTDDATWMSFNAGPHLDTHQHYDAGNLTIFRGVDLAVDSGSLDGFGSRHWFNYYARTVAHNTITITDPSERWENIWGGVPDNLAVNDGGQRTAAPLTPAPTLDEYLENRAAYDHGRIERYDEGAWGVYIRANLTNAYQNPAFQSTRPNGSRNRPKVSHVGREARLPARRGPARRVRRLRSRGLDGPELQESGPLARARAVRIAEPRGACGRRRDAIRGWRAVRLRVAREL